MNINTKIIVDKNDVSLYNRVITDEMFRQINWYKIEDFKVIQQLNKETNQMEDKVIEVTFYDRKKVKVVCSKPDTFDLKRGLFIAMAKHQLSDTHTLEGIEHAATEFSYLKGYNNIVNGAIKKYNKMKEEEEKLKREEDEREKVRKHQEQKRKEYLKRRKQRRNEEKLNELREIFNGFYSSYFSMEQKEKNCGDETLVKSEFINKGR